MIDALQIAASGMYTQQMSLDVIANNLANVNTPAFKKNRVEFEDLMYRFNIGQVLGNQGFAREQVGTGAAVAGMAKVFGVGDAKKTERAFDIAIQGDGFFEVLLPDGGYGYTRAGALHVDQEGLLVNSDGYPLSALVQVPPDAEEFIVKPDGTVLAKVASESDPIEVGRLELAKFVNASGLKPVGNNMYLPSHDSGDVLYGQPGSGGVGALMQGYLETSNVKLVEELTNLMMTQRAYEINSKVAQAADDVLGMINNLRR